MCKVRCQHCGAAVTPIVVPYEVSGHVGNPTQRVMLLCPACKRCIISEEVIPTYE